MSLIRVGTLCVLLVVGALLSGMITPEEPPADLPEPLQQTQPFVPPNAPAPEPEFEPPPFLHPPHILAQSENSIVFTGLYLLELIEQGYPLTLTLLDGVITLPEQLLYNLELDPDERLGIDFYRPTPGVFTIRLVRNGVVLPGPFVPPLTVALPWTRESPPQVSDPDGSPMPLTLEGDVVVASLSAPGSYILADTPPPPPPEDFYLPPEPEDRPWQEVALPAVIIASATGLVVIGAIVVVKVVRKKMDERSHIRRRLYKKRARDR